MGERDVSKVIRQNLEARGFKKTGPSDIYLYDFGNDALGWLGVAVLLKRPYGYYAINPNVGVHHPPLMKILDHLTEVKNAQYISLTHQIRDMTIYCEQNNIRFYLVVHEETIIATPVVNAVGQDNIIVLPRKF